MHEVTNHMLINAGSVEDIRHSLKLYESRYSVEELTKEVEAEKVGFNRTTVIKMLQAAIKRKNIGLQRKSNEKRN